MNFVESDILPVAEWCFVFNKVMFSPSAKVGLSMKNRGRRGTTKKVKRRFTYVNRAAFEEETKYYAIFRRQEGKIHNTVIHLTPNTTEYALTAALARNRHPRGTSNIPLNAARCARLTWFGAIDCTRPIRQHDYTRRRPHTVSPRIGNHPYCSGL